MTAQRIGKGWSQRWAAAETAPIWPRQEVVDFRERSNADRGGATHQPSSKLVEAKAKSLQDVSKLTVKMADVEAGILDIAELRSDGSGCFYSNFTVQGFELPKCVARCSYLHRWSSFSLFMVSALHQLLFNFEAAFMAGSGLVSTLVCSENVLDFRATYQTSALFIGLIFPLVFLIGQTWARREKAVERLASIKANAIQLVLKLVVNVTGGAFAAVKVADRTHQLIVEIGKYLPQDSQHSGLRVCSIYNHFAQLQAQPECAMLTRFMLVEFEKLRVQRDYRTPWKLNYFCFLFGSISPALCGPLFASMGCNDRYPSRIAPDDYSCEYGTRGAYVSSFFFALVISSLLSIVKAMEDPFSLSGPDDVLSSFSFELNVLLHLIEDLAPGTLKAMSQVPKQGSSQDSTDKMKGAQEEHNKAPSPRTLARWAMSKNQGAVDGEDEDADGDGLLD